MELIKIRGRGSAWNPPNRFERLCFEPDEEDGVESGVGATEFLLDATKGILAWNESPDVGFEVGLNPYRGCEHGCAYCYARPMHEYLGFSAGLDFETKILVKEAAPELLERELHKPSWRPQTIALSGATDAYQPVERKLEITRRCLRVLADFRNPVAIITKNHLVTRDIDILRELAEVDAVAVNLSITTLDGRLQQAMEPRASTPARRLSAVEALAGAGIPVGVMVAPVVPGLTDNEIPAILRSAADAGARAAGYILLRLPHGVKEIFANWLSNHCPDRRERVLNRLREMRDGGLYESRFHHRMRGHGVYAEHIRTLFDIARRRAGLDLPLPPLSAASFRRPDRGGQLPLFP
jgi:DNA repair photolyase